MARLQVETVINGEPREFLCDANQSMLDVLRDELGLTGTKEGCGTGDCGACSVLVDDRLVCSCLMLGVEASGKSVETIEGIAGEDGLHPLQRQFLENAALQCGICTPGFIVADAGQAYEVLAFEEIWLTFEILFSRLRSARIIGEMQLQALCGARQRK